MKSLCLSHLHEEWPSQEGLRLPMECPHPYESSSLILALWNPLCHWVNQLSHCYTLLPSRDLGLPSSTRAHAQRDTALHLHQTSDLSEASHHYPGSGATSPPALGSSLLGSFSFFTLVNPLLPPCFCLRCTSCNINCIVNDHVFVLGERGLWG